MTRPPRPPGVDAANPSAVGNALASVITGCQLSFGAASPEAVGPRVSTSPSGLPLQPSADSAAASPEDGASEEPGPPQLTQTMAPVPVSAARKTADLKTWFCSPSTPAGDTKCATFGHRGGPVTLRSISSSP